MLRGERKVEIRKSRALAEKTEQKKKSAAVEEKAEPALYEKLRNLRGELARKQRVPAYVVFTDAALADMCRKKPKTPEEFLEVSGVGQKKLERYGEVFLKAIREESGD